MVIQLCLVYLQLISSKTDGWSRNNQEQLSVVNTYVNSYNYFKNIFEMRTRSKSSLIDNKSFLSTLLTISFSLSIFLCWIII